MLTQEQIDKLDSRVTIEIVSVLYGIEEPAMMQACIQRIARFQHIAEAKLICDERKATGWLEFTIVLKFASGAGLTIGAIQRTPGAEIEFHS